jgi:hypothetical protein
MTIKSLKNLLSLISVLILMTVFLVMTGQNDAHASQWIKTYENHRSYYSSDLVQQTSDGGYVLVGQAAGNTVKPWIARLDVHGNILWEKTFDVYNYFVSIRQTGDSGYIIGIRGYDQQKILKLDASGTVEWQQAYLGIGDMYMSDVFPTNDGGYVAALQVDKSGYDHFKIYLLKLDVGGNILWQKAYGNDRDSVGPIAMRPVKEGSGYIIGSLACGMPPQPTASCRTIALKVDADGNVEWQKQYTTEDLNQPFSVEQSSDGGYIVAGSVRKYGAYDAWVLKLDQNGEVQ